MFYRRIIEWWHTEFIVTLLDSLPEGDVMWIHYLIIGELWNWVGLIEKTLQGCPARQLEL